MPQFTRNELIIKSKNDFMNANTEKTKDRDNLSYSYYPENISDDKNKRKKLFYACGKCDGALVQLATCVICKRTVLRICVCCHSVSKIFHVPCKIPRNNTCFTGSGVNN